MVRSWSLAPLMMFSYSSLSLCRSGNELETNAVIEGGPDNNYTVAE